MHAESALLMVKSKCLWGIVVAEATQRILHCSLFNSNPVHNEVFQYDLGPPKHTLEMRNIILIRVLFIHEK